MFTILGAVTVIAVLALWPSSTAPQGRGSHDRGSPTSDPYNCDRFDCNEHDECQF